MEEIEIRLPIKHKLKISRFPPQVNALFNERRELTALNFTNEDNRILTLSIMKALYYELKWNIKKFKIEKWFILSKHLFYFMLYKNK